MRPVLFIFLFSFLLPSWAYSLGAEEALICQRGVENLGVPQTTNENYLIANGFEYRSRSQGLVPVSITKWGKLAEAVSPDWLLNQWVVIQYKKTTVSSRNQGIEGYLVKTPDPKNAKSKYLIRVGLQGRRKRN